MIETYGRARLIIVAAAAALLTLAGLLSDHTAHGAPAHGADRVPVADHFTWRKAASTKRSLGGRVLVLDIRRNATASPATAFDAHVPFVDQEADENGQMTFHTDFTMKADDALRAAHLKHSSPVFLVCDDSRCGDLAAALLHEHGYERLYVVSDPENSDLRDPDRHRG